MILNEKSLDMNAFPPYSMANTERFSLGHIVTIASSHIERIQDKQWINPYRSFMKLNEEIYRHFRHIAKNTQYDIQKSFLSSLIANTIKHIATVYLNILEQKITGHPRHNEEFVNQVGWYQSFFWAMFSDRTEVESSRAVEVSDAMATIGLQFANAGSYKIAENSISNICSVAKYYIEKAKIPDPYRIADIIICVWQLRYFAEHKGNTPLVQKADEKLKEVIDLDCLKQVNIKEAFDIRKQQIDSHLQDYNPVRMPIDSSDYLKLFIQNSEKKEGDKSAGNVTE